MTFREKMAWVAGFVEADGSFSSARLLTRAGTTRQQRYPCLAVGQRDPEVLYRIKEYLGFGLVHERHTSNHYNYRANGRELTQAATAMLWEFMGPIKRAQAVRVIQDSRL